MGEAGKQGKKDGDEEILGVTRSGMVITEEIAEQMAEEIEREDFDISNFKILYVGYPVLSGAASGSGVAFPLSQAELDAVRRRAEKEGHSFSDEIREELNRRTDS